MNMLEAFRKCFDEDVAVRCKAWKNGKVVCLENYSQHKGPHFYLHLDRDPDHGSYWMYPAKVTVVEDVFGEWEVVEGWPEERLKILGITNRDVSTQP